MFFFLSRSAHLSTWKEILNVKYTDGSDLAEYLKRVDVKIEELDRAGFCWSKDSTKGTSYQLGLSSSFRNVSNVLNSRLRPTPDVLIGAKEVEEIIRSTNDDLGRDGSLVTSFNSVGLGKDPAGDPDMNFNAYNQRYQGWGMASCGVYWPPSLRGSMFNSRGTVRRMTPVTRTSARDFRHCLACGEEGHWVRFCPHMKDPLSTPRTTLSATNPNTPSPSQFNPSRNFRFNLVDANGTEFQAEASIAPEYGDLSLPEGIWGSEGNLTEAWDHPDQAVGDTGATHMITGDLLMLTDVRLLARRVPISVATRGPQAFVTAKGTLHLKADNGASVAVPNVFYSSQASRTLISIPEVI